ncbi:MAG: hypothetical protein K6T61_17850, partial [Bryobacteraceae bacterium]|nr:hypothetical protein [Bryobacteraceae bacterium]
RSLKPAAGGEQAGEASQLIQNKEATDNSNQLGKESKSSKDSPEIPTNQQKQPRIPTNPQRRRPHHTQMASYGDQDLRPAPSLSLFPSCPTS